MSENENPEEETPEEETPEEETPEEETPVQDQHPGIAGMNGGIIVPLHAVNLPVKRGPGRPRKVGKKPTTDDLIYHAEMMRQKEAFILKDELVKATSSRLETLETLQAVKSQIAREAAALLFARMELEKHGKDTTQISSRRIASLREITSIEMEIKRLGVTIIDLKSERFQKIFTFFLTTVKDSAVEVMSPELVDLLFNRLETKLEGWEEKAQNL